MLVGGIPVLVVSVGAVHEPAEADTMIPNKKRIQKQTRRPLRVVGKDSLSIE